MARRGTLNHSGEGVGWGGEIGAVIPWAVEGFCETRRKQYAQKGCRNGGGILAWAFVLAVEQIFQFLLQIAARPFFSAASNAFMVGP